MIMLCLSGGRFFRCHSMSTERAWGQTLNRKWRFPQVNRELQIVGAQDADFVTASHYAEGCFTIVFDSLHSVSAVLISLTLSRIKDEHLKKKRKWLARIGKRSESPFGFVMLHWLQIIFAVTCKLWRMYNIIVSFFFLPSMLVGLLRQKPRRYLISEKSMSEDKKCSFRTWKRRQTLQESGRVDRKD